MIYCNVMGGLGNIMFQVSATFSFSIDKNIDCSFPNIESQFDYLKDENGNYWDMAGNIDFMFPMYEMSGEKTNIFNIYIMNKTL